MHSRRWLGVLLAAAALTAGGCERVSGRDGDGARQLVTTGFGAEVRSDGPVAAGVTVLDALRADADVETAFGGGFVNAIDGVASDPQAGRDWFYYVNGMQPGSGADALNLRTGDRVWWDYRPWRDHPRAPAVVGSWPEPFVNGYPSTPEGVSADPPLDRPLAEAGARLTSGDARWRVLVGADADLRRRDAAWRRAADDPAGDGLTVRLTADGAAALRRDGREFVPVPGGRAVAVLIPSGATPDDGGAVFVVAGHTAADARAAALRIARDPAVLARAYGVVFDAAGEPVAAGGRVAP